MARLRCVAARAEECRTARESIVEQACLAASRGGNMQSLRQWLAGSGFSAAVEKRQVTFWILVWKQRCSSRLDQGTQAQRCQAKRQVWVLPEANMPIQTAAGSLQSDDRKTDFAWQRMLSSVSDCKHTHLPCSLASFTVL